MEITTTGETRLSMIYFYKMTTIISRKRVNLKKNKTDEDEGREEESEENEGEQDNENDEQDDNEENEHNEGHTEYDGE